ncbi:MAG: PqqD family protein [Candidatus Omnitrophica bacterium]|nr:PqqD family protein [Candidatus Omnitrophota bacterium]
MKLKKFVKTRDEKFGEVIFDTLKEKVFVTNETGKDIVDLLQQGYSSENIVRSLSDLYNKEPAEIQNDILSFIDSLKNNSLIEV